MTTWDYLNAPLNFIGAVLIIYELLSFGDRLILSERLGMGLVGASMFLNVARIVEMRYTTPFEGWSSSLFAVGITLYIGGRLVRHWRHKHANAAQNVIAADYLRGRQKP